MSLKKFENQEQFEQYKQSPDYKEPNISIVGDTIMYNGMGRSSEFYLNLLTLSSGCINTDVLNGFPYQKTLTDEEFCQVFEINNVTDFKVADWYFIKQASNSGYILENVLWVGHDLYKEEGYDPEDAALLVIGWGNNAETLSVKENNNSYYAVYSRVD